MKKLKSFLTTLLAVTGFLMASMTVAAAEPDTKVIDPIVADAIAEADAIIADAVAKSDAILANGVNDEESTALSNAILNEAVDKANQLVADAVNKVDGTSNLTENSKQVQTRSIYGYAAHDTNPTTGSFIVNAPGSGNSKGTFQVTTHGFTGSPVISASAYRPNGTFAAQIYINGNGTKTASFSNAIAGNYEIFYTVAGDVYGWISAWISS